MQKIPEIYFDVNIILDWALQREPFFNNAKQLVEVLERGEIEGYVSPLAMANAHYFVRKKLKDKALTHEFLVACQQLFKFIDNSATALTQAIDNSYKDFEDDLHFYSAIEAGMDLLVTRNEQDFPQDKNMQILSPEQLLYALGY